MRTNGSWSGWMLKTQICKKIKRAIMSRSDCLISLLCKSKLKKFNKLRIKRNKKQKWLSLQLAAVEEDFNRMIIKIFIKNIKYFNKKTMRAEDGIKKYINKYLKNKINQTLKTKNLTKYIQTDMDRTTSLKLITKQNNLKSQTFSTLRVKTQWPSFLNSCMKPF